MNGGGLSNKRRHSIVLVAVEKTPQETDRLNRVVTNNLFLSSTLFIRINCFKNLCHHHNTTTVDTYHEYPQIILNLKLC